jgi:Fe-S-cluster containining protein
LNITQKLKKYIEDYKFDLMLYLAEKYSVRLTELIVDDFEISAEIRQKVVDDLSKKLQKEIEKYRIKAIEQKTQTKCIGCGACCKFAVSEYSYNELKKAIKKGDKTAKDFLSVFVPYETEAEAIAVYPEYVAFLKECSEGDSYFYHCPKVTKDNRCPDYENRPKVCRDFPSDPMSFLPPTCGYNKWRVQNINKALKIAAKTFVINEIIEHGQKKS